MIDLNKAVCRLPTMTNIIAGIVSDLMAGTSVVWVVPATAPVSDLAAELAHSLDEHGIEVTMGGGNGQDDDGNGGGIAGGGFSQVAIEHLESVAAGGAREALVARLEEQGRAATIRSSRTGVVSSAAVVCTEAAVGYHASQHEHISVHWHWGCLSTAEMSILAHALLQGKLTDPIHAAWAQSVIAELAGTDVELLAQVCARWQPSFEEDDLFNTLSEYASQRGWTDGWLQTYTNEMQEAFRPGRRIKPPCPPHNLAPLFEAGVLEWRPDSGISMHTAALAQSGDVTEIRRRIWAGQAKYLMPVIDRERTETYQYLSQNAPGLDDFVRDLRSGPSRPGIWNNGWAASEWIELIMFIDEMCKGRFIAVRRRADFMRMRRNDLAHCSPLPWEHFRMVLSGEA